MREARRVLRSNLGKLRQTLPILHAVKRPSPGGFAAIGDSITAGHSRPDWWLHARDSWVSYLVRRVPYCYNGALPETPTPALVERLPLVLARRPDTLVLVVGTYDLWKQQAEKGLDDLAGMALSAEAAGVAPIFATLPPIVDYGAPVREWNRAVYELADGRPLIDFHAALEVDGEYGPELTTDGLHPSLKGARVMAEAARSVLTPTA